MFYLRQNLKNSSVCSNLQKSLIHAYEGLQELVPAARGRLPRGDLATLRFKRIPICTYMYLLYALGHPVKLDPASFPYEGLEHLSKCTHKQLNVALVVSGTVK